MIGLMAVGIGFICAFVALALLKLIAFFTNLFFFQRLSLAPASPADNTLGLFVILVPVAGALDHRPDGPLRIRTHPRPWHPRGDRGHPHQRQPGRAEGRAAQADLVRDLDRLGRPVRRRGSDHHDRRRDRVADRAVLSSHERRTEDAAGGRRGRGYVGDLRRPDRVGPARGRTAALRVEAAQHDPGRAGKRHRRGHAPLHPRARPAVPGAGAPDLHRTGRTRRVRRRGPAGRRAVGAAHARRLRGRRRLPEAAHPLDVVAGDRRAGDRRRRADLSAGARRRLRHHRPPAARRRAAPR